jgi:hypothetical protein
VRENNRTNPSSGIGRVLKALWYREELVQRLSLEKHGGAFALFVVSCSILFAGQGPTILAPAPLTLFLVLLLTIVLFPFVTTALYLVSTRYLYPRHNASNILLATVLVISSLDFWYISSSWELGVRYQGMAHTKAIAIVNVLVLFLIISLSIAAKKTGSNKLVKQANFGLLLALSWCLFPYLGELP